MKYTYATPQNLTNEQRMDDLRCSLSIPEVYIDMARLEVYHSSIRGELEKSISSQDPVYAYFRNIIFTMGRDLPDDTEDKIYMYGVACTFLDRLNHSTTIHEITVTLYLMYDMYNARGLVADFKRQKESLICRALFMAGVVGKNNMFAIFKELNPDYSMHEVIDRVNHFNDHQLELFHYGTFLDVLGDQP